MLARLSIDRDEAAVLALVKMQIEETLPHLRYDEDVTRETFQACMKAAATLFVVEDRREVVGFLYALIHNYAFTDGFYVGQEVIYVRPDKRGTRAAAALIQLFNEWADRLGAKEVFMGVANGRSPERTARFMQHFGFTPVGSYLRRIRG